MTSAAAWLVELGLAQCAEISAEQTIDCGVNSDLTGVDLNKLGIALGHCKWMLKATRAAVTSTLCVAIVLFASDGSD
jgi:SAM domain (Sterile alpha motif)